MSMATVTQAQVIARINVQTGAYARERTPVSIDLSGLPAGPYTLYAVNGRQRVKVACQTEPALVARLWWQLEEHVPANTTRTYELEKGTGDETPVVTLKDDQHALTLQSNGHAVLQYNYTTVYPPQGVDSSYRRSGFIHPAWSPKGKVLTGIHPKDHWHHIGIWNPWTDTEFEGQNIDFWNLYKKTGTVRFVHFLSQTQGAVWGGFKALQAHVVLGAAEKTALNEVWDIRAYNNASMLTWEFTSVLSCATASPVLLKHYRYGGGFGFRGNAAWNNETSAMITSEGKTRKNADSTYMRWFKIAGTSEEGKAGLLVLVSPDNFNFPQPIRVWPEKDKDVFINISPTKDRPWELTYGHEYTQKYRVITYDDDITAEKAEALWRDYAHPPVVTVKALVSK